MILNQMTRDTEQQVKSCSAPHAHGYPLASPTDELPVQVLIACLSSSPDCGENADNRIRSVHMSRCVRGEMWVRVCVTSRVRKKVECVSVLQGMGDEVAVLAVVIDAAVSIVFASR